jgi:3-deoxy-D-manno-octulosonic-acid transferase
MPYFLNIAYFILLLAASPWLAWKALRTGKYRQGLLRKFLGLAPALAGGRPRAWFHAVSVGEVLLLRQVIGGFRRRFPDWDCVVSTTTNTGYDLARATYPDLTVFYWPLDFTWAVGRALDRVVPRLVVLAELELWPNFLTAAARRGVALAVVNGRLSPRSFRGYSRVRPLMGRWLRLIDLLAVQDDDYARRLLDLGAPGDRLFVTGSVKYDGVTTDRDNPKTRALGTLLGRTGDQLVWVVGSTQAPEEELALEVYREARERFPSLRLFLVPRHKERFEEVAGLLAASGLLFARRSRLTGAEPPAPVVLMDTLGELGAVWGLADLAFVGGSLSPRGGQNMIEPAGYGVPVMFGPNVWNFRETVDRLLERHAAVQVADADAWRRETLRLLGDAPARAVLGERARAFVLSQQGATDRTLDLLAELVAGGRQARAARAA